MKINNQIVIVGGSGFIGSHLCNLFSTSNIQFSIYDVKESLVYKNKVIRGDINDIDSLTQSIKEGSILINLAAEHHDNVIPKSLYYLTNVQGAINLCNVARKKNVRSIIFTSSVAVYGFSKEVAGESAKINPYNDYGISKYQSELVYKAWQNEDPNNRTLIIIRPTVVFGKNNRGNVYKLFSLIASRKFIMIGGGGNKKSLAYVENLVSFIHYSLKFTPGLHVFNYVDKPDYSLNKLIKDVFNSFGLNYNFKLRIPFTLALTIGYFFDFVNFIFNSKLPFSSIRIKKFCADSVYESSAFTTGFIPPFTLAAAIQKTIEHEFPSYLRTTLPSEY